MPNLTINEDSLCRLKELYQKALDDGKDSFEFQGQTLVVGYAKYLIEYAENELHG